MATTSAGGPSAAEGRSDRERVEEGTGVAAHVEGGRAVQAEGEGSVADSSRSPNGGDWLTVITTPGASPPVEAATDASYAIVRASSSRAGVEGLDPGRPGRP